MTIGIAILSYITREEHKKRLHNCLQSLDRSGFLGEVFVVDDGSLIRREGLCYYKKERGGISRGKNTCIRLLMEKRVTIGFLADDDILFRRGWWRPYVEAHRKTNYQHFSWAKEKFREQLIEYKGQQHWKLNGLNGCLLSFTPQVVEKVGGFEVTKGLYWGWDHVNWTNRIIAAELAPYYCDVVDSEYCIALGNYESPVTLNERRKCREYEFEKIGSIYRKLIE